MKDAGENNDGYGSALAAGDFNHDGYFDLAIGVPFEDISTVTDSGAVHVMYGSASGFLPYDSLDQFWYQNKTGVEDSVEHVDSFGAALASGDFDSDGFDDLAVGVPLEVVNDFGSSQGAVNVLYGSLSGLRTTSPGDQFWNQDTSGVEENAVGYDHFGYSPG